MIRELLEFYSALGRPISVMEAARLGGVSPQAAARELERLAAGGGAREENGFFSISGGPGAAARRKQDLALDLKWRKLRRLARFFRYLPFLEFVAASGSMAIGNAGPSSDFDVLIGVRAGRMFTARYALNLIFGLAGERRLDDAEGSSPDKLCFNHFVTEASFAKPPWNAYRKELYRNLVPICGDPAAVRRFFLANAACGGGEKNIADLRFRPGGPNAAGRFWEALLGGRFGGLVERKLLAPIAKRRLRAYVTGKPPGGRAVVSDEELEFHFDLRHEKRFARLRSL